MAFQYSDRFVHATLDAAETVIGASPTLRIYSGTVPATTATARTGTLLLSIALPADWMADASARAKAKSGTWSANAAAAGVAGYFDILGTGGTVDVQGPCNQGTAAVSGEMILVNTNITATQPVTIATFQFVGPAA